MSRHWRQLLLWKKRLLIYPYLLSNSLQSRLIRNIMNTHWSLEYWPRPDLRRIVKSSPKYHRITIWWRACQTSNWEKIAQSTSIYTFLWCWTRERFIWDDDDYVEHIPKDEKLFWSLLAPLQRPVETFIRLEQGLHGQVYSECVKVICRLVWLSVPLCKKTIWWSLHSWLVWGSPSWNHWRSYGFPATISFPSQYPQTIQPSSRDSINHSKSNSTAHVEYAQLLILNAQCSCMWNMFMLIL